MTNAITKDKLAAWIEDLKEAAKDDTSFSISFYGETASKPFAIIAGWMECFSDNSEVDDLFCCSKSQPKYCMCIKIAKNEGPYASTDYEIMDMPYDPKTGEVDNTEVMLEWNDHADYVAEFFMHEWERIMETYGEDN